MEWPGSVSEKADLSESSMIYYLTDRGPIGDINLFQKDGSRMSKCLAMCHRGEWLRCRKPPFGSGQISGDATKITEGEAAMIMFQCERSIL